MTTYIIDAIRTPRARGNDKSALFQITPQNLLGGLFKELSTRYPHLDKTPLSAYIGCVSQVKEQGTNIGKLASLQSQWTQPINATTINNYCTSGLIGVNLAAQQSLYKEGIALGGGVEMMSRVAMGSDQGSLTHDLYFQHESGLIPIGIAADVIATRENFSREECDQYALQSQQRAKIAQDEQRFKSILTVHSETGDIVLDKDETNRPSTSLERLASLSAAFTQFARHTSSSHPELGSLESLAKKLFNIDEISYVHHAGNSPATADGASLVLVAHEHAVKNFKLNPRARIVAMADCADDPKIGLTGAITSTEAVLKRAQLSINDIDVFEVNEAFAGVILHYIKHFNIDPTKININGGAIALGHAMGATGGTLVSMALDELERTQKRYALISLCGAAGVGVATIIERV